MQNPYLVPGHVTMHLLVARPYGPRSRCEHQWSDRVMCFTFSNGRHGRTDPRVCLIHLFFLDSFGRWCGGIVRATSPKRNEAKVGQLLSELGSTSRPTSHQQLGCPLSKVDLKWRLAPRVRVTRWRRYLYHPPVVSTNTSSVCVTWADLSECDNRNAVFPTRTLKFL